MSLMFYESPAVRPFLVGDLLAPVTYLLSANLFLNYSIEKDSLTLMPFALRLAVLGSVFSDIMLVLILASFFFDRSFWLKSVPIESLYLYWIPTLPVVRFLLFTFI